MRVQLGVLAVVLVAAVPWVWIRDPVPAAPAFRPEDPSSPAFAGALTNAPNSIFRRLAGPGYDRVRS